jgi:hypothetical protein
MISLMFQRGTGVAPVSDSKNMKTAEDGLSYD